MIHQWGKKRDKYSYGDEVSFLMGEDRQPINKQVKGRLCQMVIQTEEETKARKELEGSKDR